MRLDDMTCELNTGTEFDTSSTSLVDDTESTYYMKIPKDCADYNLDGGVFWIHVHSMRKAIQVYCERGWTVLMRRTGPELDFNRSWEAYKNGFGNIASDHWLGLEAFHRLTNQGDYSLMIEVRDMLTDSYFWNIHERFLIGSEGDQYLLK
ncbi:angiopoietin-4-like, partial [Lingula anatina]|uniref:Angiopoietin-4-like n=1 Tax=Lingula anatina TaxID=7574 RepID=A0A1S3IAP0_LINAN